jgi:hypothetical protein
MTDLPMGDASVAGQARMLAPGGVDHHRRQVDAEDIQGPRRASGP